MTFPNLNDGPGKSLSIRGCFVFLHGGMIGPLIFFWWAWGWKFQKHQRFSQIFLLCFFSRKCCIHHHPSILQPLYFGYIPQGLPQIPWVFSTHCWKPSFFSSMVPWSFWGSWWFRFPKSNFLSVESQTILYVN